jgi:hypothetical protein
VHIAIVEETTRGAHVGVRISDEIRRCYFDELDYPVKSMNGGRVLPTAPKVLERAALSDVPTSSGSIASSLNIVSKLVPAGF